MKLFLKFFFIGVLILSRELSAQETGNIAATAGRYVGTSTYDVVNIPAVKGRKVKNVILMIGDGMGLGQMSAAWVANGGRLNIDNMTYSGLSRTWCHDRLITDSGAAGTAMATGSKARYHSIAVDTSGIPLPSLTDLAGAAGLSTGIMVTCNLTDATPSVFCANNTDRDREEEIAAGYLDCDVDYIFGAGREKFNARKDGRNLLAEMETRGYSVCTTWEATQNTSGDKIFSVISDGQLPLAKQRGDLFRKAVMKGITHLSANKKGFFAMVEGSRIDDCGHSNNLTELIEEVSDFDITVGEVLRWAAADKHTLVIVVADHETGGLTLLDGSIKNLTVTGNFSTKGHSGIMVPVYSYGPEADKFSGVYENTEIFRRIKEILRLN